MPTLKTLLLLPIVFGSCTFGRKTLKSDEQALFEIYFQGRFSNDTVSLKINGCVIAEKISLTNDKREGITNLHLQAYTASPEQMTVFYKGKTFNCRDEAGRVFISIRLNGTPLEYPVDLTYGKYLGFSKVSSSELSFRQSINPVSFH